MNTTLKEYIEQNNIYKNIAVLLFTKNNKMLAIEYSPYDIRNKLISKELLNMEVMDVVDEDDAIEIWVM